MIGNFNVLLLPYTNRLIPPRIKYWSSGYTVVWKQAPKNDHGSNSDPLHQIRADFSYYKLLIEMVPKHNFGNSDAFLQFFATKNYYHSKVLDTLFQIKNNDAATQRRKERMRQEIARLDQQVPQASDYDIMLKLSTQSYGLFQRSPNRLFLILPTNLDYWNETNIAKHAFRLYFMCNNTETAFWDPSIQPHHVHISCHPGYALIRPQEFLQHHGSHALAVLLMVKYGYRDFVYDVPDLDSSKIVKNTLRAIPHHGLTNNNIGPLVNKAIAYVRSFLKRNQNSRPNCHSWDIVSFLNLDGNDNGTGDLVRHKYGESFENQWICKDHVPLDPGTRALEKFVQSRGTMDRQNSTLKVTLASRSEAYRLATYMKGKAWYFELSVSVSWKPSRSELQEVCQVLVRAGFPVLHVHGVSSSIVSQGPIEFTCSCTSLIVLHDYLQPGESYVCITPGQERKGHIGLFFRRKIEVSGIFWDHLAYYLFDEVLKIRKRIAPRAFKELTKKLDQQTALDLSGISVFDPVSNGWQGRFGFTEGKFPELDEASIPCTRFSAADLERGLLRRLVLQSYNVDDMLRVISLMERNPMLKKIEVPAKVNSVFEMVASIRQGCHSHALPLELTFVHQQETVLARVAIRGIDNPESSEARSHSEKNPAIDIQEWRLDHVSGPIRDEDAQLLESASLLFSTALTSLTLDTTALTAQGLVSLKSVLQRSTLEHLHIKCVPFMPFFGASIGQVLRAIQWPTIKSLSLSGNNIDDWLKLWVSDGGLQDLVGVWIHPSSPGPSLLSLDVIARQQNQVVLSHTSALAICRLLYSCRLVELRLENILLKNKAEWDLVLGGVHYSSLRSVSLKGSNASDSQRRITVRGRPLLRMKDRVGGWLRNNL